MSKGSIHVKKISSLQDEIDYIEFVKNFPGAFYYSLVYQRFLVHLLGCTPFYWLAYIEDHLVGVLPTMVLNGPYGKVINSLPYYGSHGGVLSVNDNARASLIRQFDHMTREEGVLSSTLIENLAYPETVEPMHDFIDTRLSQVTPLSNNESFLLALFQGSARRNINKAKAAEVNVFVENDSLDFLYQTHVDNMSIIGGKAKSEKFFHEIPNFFSPNVDFKVWVARRNGRKIAALLVFYSGISVEYFTPVTVNKEREWQPMAAILWEAMRDAGLRGYSSWNWGGTWQTQDGVYRFKKKWGAVDGTYRYFTKIRNDFVLNLSPLELLSLYPDFYVIPFQKLRDMP